ncbi:polysaccharide deacetylase family protein [Lutibacter sp.]|uniref:polysaccharide deacetylase family protein n=1 Tax=Lutibacter sp. TaxID=1925666 RepID=UPI0025BAA189|nr:polysaccharide deacetylase family protein [Lutibacter sp.]MCF6167528.1 polysaccharide deacetylase family protein [Lutibacter sp.]
MILVYCNHKSNRLTYTLNVIFKYILKIEYCIVDIDTFNQSTNQTKLNYSSLQLKNCISIRPHSLLFETSIEPQQIAINWIDNIPYFFKTSDNSSFKYDILASSFFMVSRYEEYLPTNLDIHNRFKAEDSIAFKNNFLEIPVVNLWVLELKKEILKKQPNFIFPKLKYKFMNTIDIDVAYAYKGKGFIRHLGGTLKAILTLNTGEIKHKFNYFIKNQKDPYNTYDTLDRLQELYNTKNIYFFHLGNYTKFDKSLSFKSKELKYLTKKIARKNKIGIHPSYASNYFTKKIQLEISRLQKIVNKKVVNSRQHYLKLEFPTTYEQLIACNIKHDFTMGFASTIGFRAGLSTTYPFFNILKNKERELLITPFQIMDGTLNQYLNLSPTEAIEKIKAIVEVTKKVNGTFVSLWHNSSLCERDEWKEWTIVYEKLLQIARDN